MQKIGRHREAKRRSRIGMYKIMHNVYIENNKGESLLSEGIPFVLATDNRTLC
jgi:hypothetical protein